MPVFAHRSVARARWVSVLLPLAVACSSGSPPATGDDSGGSPGKGGTSSAAGTSTGGSHAQSGCGRRRGSVGTGGSAANGGSSGSHAAAGGSAGIAGAGAGGSAGTVGAVGGSAGSGLGGSAGSVSAQGGGSSRKGARPGAAAFAGMGGGSGTAGGGAGGAGGAHATGYFSMDDFGADTSGMQPAGWGQFHRVQQERDEPFGGRHARPGRHDDARTVGRSPCIFTVARAQP